MNTEVKEKLRWFQILASLYDIATPHIEAFTGLKCQAIEQRIVDMEVVDRNAHVLRKLLALTENIPEPPEDEMNRIKKHFETALSSCINASEALINRVLAEFATEPSVSIILEKSNILVTFKSVYMVTV